MKKTGMIFVFAIFSILFLNFASAYFPGSLYLGRGGDLVDNIVTAGAPVLEVLFGGYTESVGEFSSGEMLFFKFLIFILMFVIIQAILKKIDLFKENNAVIGILSVAIPLIAVRFMSANQLLYGVIMQYGVLGVALTTVLPFIIFFYFLYNSGMNAAVRRFAWIFYLVVMIAIWLNRVDQSTDLENYVFIGTLLVILLSTIFDRTIKAHLGIGKWYKLIGKTEDQTANNIWMRYSQLMSSITPGVPVPKKVENEIKQLKKDYKKLTKESLD